MDSFSVGGVMYYSTKTYGHEKGLSCAFRQPKATHSHCSFIHGYALSFKFTFGCSTLDDKNWCVDFGGLKELKQWLEDSFDHKLAVDINDPHLEDFKELENKGLCEMIAMDGVGCEMFAKHAFDFADNLINTKYSDRCWVESVEVSEHAGNSATYTPFTIRKERYKD